ncbi:MAG: c-type cytochrome [bacterium]
MSEVHIEEHSSPIKTPKQLIIVVVLAFLVPIVLMVMLSQLVTSGLNTGKDNPAQSGEAIAKRLKPVGQVEVVDPSTPKAEKTGKEIVEAVCGACHVSGALNATKIGDKAAWGKLIGQGLPRLTQSAIKGIRSMPARGGNPDLSDTELARAIVYMANQSGGSLKEPALKAPAAAAPAASTVAAPAAAAATGAVPAKTDTNKGKAVYEASCISCHAAGVAGAPKTGDKAAWAPRLKAGMDALYASSLKGKGAMPPKGGNLQVSDADIKAAVDYLIGLAK